jgi:cytochrome c553
MKKAKFLGIAISTILVFLAIAYGAVIALSEWVLQRTYQAPTTELSPPAYVDLNEGKRMAQIVGCLNGCHGQNGEGGYEEIKGLFKNTAPTLSDIIPQYSDAELVRLIRYGVKRDGTSAFGMTSYTFWSLGTQDLANIIACLRLLPKTPPVERRQEISWKGRMSLITGDWKVSAEQVDRSRPRWGDSTIHTLEMRGRYLASITCTECHGLDYKGNPLERAPSLAVIGAYSDTQFQRLMRTAKPIAARELDENMRWVADAPFTDEEINGIYAFLRSYHGFD